MSNRAIAMLAKAGYQPSDFPPGDEAPFEKRARIATWAGQTAGVRRHLFRENTSQAAQQHRPTSRPNCSPLLLESKGASPTPDMKVEVTEAEANPENAFQTDVQTSQLTPARSAFEINDGSPARQKDIEVAEGKANPTTSENAFQTGVQTFQLSPSYSAFENKDDSPTRQNMEIEVAEAEANPTLLENTFQTGDERKTTHPSPSQPLLRTNDGLPIRSTPDSMEIKVTEAEVNSSSALGVKDDSVTLTDFNGNDIFPTAAKDANPRTVSIFSIDDAPIESTIDSDAFVEVVEGAQFENNPPVKSVNDINVEEVAVPIRQNENDILMNENILHDENTNDTFITGIIDEISNQEIIQEQEPEPNQDLTPENGKKRTRKRQRRPDTWQVNINKQKRQAGEEYVNKKGVTVPAKPMGPGCKTTCRFKCHSKVSQEARELVHLTYRKKVTGDQARWLYVTKHVKEENKKENADEDIPSRRTYSYVYHLPVRGQSVKVCKTMFLSTHHMANSVVLTAFRKAGPDGTPSPSKQGKHSKRGNAIKPEVKESVREHIRMFPKVESHYIRKDSTKEYIEEGWTVAKMHRAYLKWMEGKKNIEASENNEEPIPVDALSDVTSEGDLMGDEDYDPAEEPVEENDETVPEIEVKDPNIAHYRLYLEIYNTEFNIEVHKPKKGQCELCCQYK